MAEKSVELQDGGLTDNQKDLLAKFSDLVEDVRQPDHDDHYLTRWLKARQWDLTKAEDMLRKHLVWREKFNIDNIQEYEAPAVLRKYFPGGPGGYDKENNPIWITPSGGLDMKGLTLSAKRSDIIMYNMQKVEETMKRMAEQSKRCGKPVDKVIIIDDFEGFTMKKLLMPGMDLLLKILAIVEANYPELLKACYIVNAPRWWSVIFNLCKPFLSEDTKNKMFVLGSDWREKIRAEVDVEQLPELWGGSLTPEQNETYLGKICLGGDVPSSFFLKERCIIDPDRVTKVTVAAGARIDIEFKVKEPNSLLKWVFKTDSHDVAFGVTYVIDVSTSSLPPSPTKSSPTQKLKRSMSKNQKGEGNPHVEIIPIARVNCHQLPEDGYIECEQAGTYIVHFCNSHSWLTSKKLQYYIQVITPTAKITDSKETDNMVTSIQNNVMAEDS